MGRKMADKSTSDVNCNGKQSNNVNKDYHEKSMQKKMTNGTSKDMHGNARFQRGYKAEKLSSLTEIFIVILKVVFSVFAWILIACFVLPVTPILLLFMVAKYTERYGYWYLRGVETVTGGDSVWLSNGPENPGIISSVMFFKGEVHVEKFRKRILETMVKEKFEKTKQHPYRRSTKTVSTSVLNHLWIEEENFDINEHVKSHSEKLNSKAALRHVISDLCTIPFRKGMSQWDFVIIPWTHNGEEKTAVVFRLNHSVADGGALVNYLTNVLPDIVGEPVRMKKFSQSGRIFMTLKGTLLSPIFLLRMMFGFADATVLHGKPLAGQKVVTWSEPIDIETLKMLKTATKTTLNDVLVSCMTASIREFFIKRNLEPPQNLKVSLPIDLRKNTEADAVEFENRFAVLQLALPIGISDPLEQLYEVQNRMNTLKTSGEPFAVGPTMDMLLNIVPTFIISPFFNFIVSKCTGVLSNVPGPQNTLTIVGKELESMTFWAPPRANLGMTFSITSYNGKVVIGVQSDKAILDDPEDICREFPAQVKRLNNRLNMYSQ